MRYYNYLNEGNLNKFITNNDVYRLASLNQQYIYRGKNEFVDEYKIFTRRTDRKPRDTPFHLHQDFDSAFKKQFGWNVRSSGVFAISDKKLAEDYGDAYIFVPIKPYKYVWSKRICDLFLEIDSSSKNGFYSYDDLRLLKDDENRDTDEYDDLITDAVKTYQDKDLIGAIKSGHEIIFDCNQYILFDIDYFKDISQ